MKTIFLMTVMCLFGASLAAIILPELTAKSTPNLTFAKDSETEQQEELTSLDTKTLPATSQETLLTNTAESTPNLTLAKGSETEQQEELTTLHTETKTGTELTTLHTETKTGTSQETLLTHTEDTTNFGTQEGTNELINNPLEENTINTWSK